MKNLTKSLVYTKQKKEYQLTELRESKREQPLQNLNLYLENEKGRGVPSLAFDRLSVWNHWNFINHYINNDSVDYNYLAKSTLFSIESNNWDFFIGKLVETYDSAVPLHKAVKVLGQMLYLGWREKAIEYGNFLLKNINSKHYKGGVSKPIHSWFMLELFCKWQKIELDREKLYYPSDLKIYKEVLDNWDTNDSNLLNKLVDKLSDFHINNSDEYVKTDKNGNEFSPDFTSSDYFIFAIEILMWLFIRKDLGLVDYTPDNELMTLKINQFPNQIIPYPKEEIVEQCKAKLKKENPTIEFDL
ncbi:hypothetical protein [Neisseria montereyensis]|uniref:Uncharacterized protein n=1 Tax=Neisseria montereyensis TaxID=2973938 RepID=A0ABT2FBX2_9NEIS|nr:hypothetical protein [Neisseria montereyensis]MCS4533013.1 hypothetical protein [Neisseria montereyensis]